MSPDNELQTEVRRLENKMEAMEARILAAIEGMRKDNAAAVARIEAKQSERDKTCASANAANLARDREIRDLKEAEKASAEVDKRLARVETSLGFLVKFGWVIAAATVGMIGNTVWTAVLTHTATKAAGG